MSKPIRGGRAYSLAKLAGSAIMLVWISVFILVLRDVYAPALNNLVLMVIATLGTLGGAAQLPNIAERWGGAQPDEYTPDPPPVP